MTGQLWQEQLALGAGIYCEAKEHHARQSVHERLERVTGFDV
jgi:hypothetical protein